MQRQRIYMDQEFREYRFARIEGHRITQARLQAKFKNGISDLDSLETAIEQVLTDEAGPWRTGDIEQEGFREGARLAALDFYWQHRRELRDLSSNPKTLLLLN